MRNLLKVFGGSVAAMGAFALVVAAADAAETGRAAYDRVSRASSQRMPTMPSLPINSVGNLSPNLPTNSNGGGNAGMKCPDGATGVYPKCDCGDNKLYDADTNTCNACGVSGQVVVNGACVCPDGMHVDASKNACVMDSECPDGGVKNSEYTVEKCMNDVLACVNNGALPGGLNDLFNEDLRNSIVNGMGICSVQIDKCIAEVRKDCRNIYRVAADVWLDFNTRKVQPEYYSFVLRKTGLTPYQAENTCWLLDKNTFGSSFAAVSNGGNVTREYNYRVGAYNNQAGDAQKNAPQGVTVNNNNPGVDGQRGHYARWDAATAECWLRVAAYNKDKHIKNSWLFGALGDDEPAEVWKLAGDTFQCNKDLFGFSLMNDTSTAAVVGVGGGTLVGAGVGAIAGHGDREFDCSRDSHRKKLGEQLREVGNTGILNEYMEPGNQLATTGDITVEQCYDIVNLYNVYRQLNSALKECGGVNVVGEKELSLAFSCQKQENETWDKCFETYATGCVGHDFNSLNECSAWLLKQCYDADDKKKCLLSHGVNASIIVEEDLGVSGRCTFHPINYAKSMGTGIYCTAESGCKTATDIRSDVDRLGRVLNRLEILQGEDNNRLSTTLIGAGVGAGAGGVATAITAFVERNNINCRVGDGLAQVGFGKSYSIGSLKDFYVKWNLRLPDTVAPTAQVKDCESWKQACGTMTNARHCETAQINYKPDNAPTTTLIRAACVMSGSACIENYSVAKSYGACE